MVAEGVQKGYFLRTKTHKIQQARGAIDESAFGPHESSVTIHAARPERKLLSEPLAEAAHSGKRLRDEGIALSLSRADATREIDLSLAEDLKLVTIRLDIAASARTSAWPVDQVSDRQCSTEGLKGYVLCNAMECLGNIPLTFLVPPWHESKSKTKT
ncbi:hypothetical protein M426DRAFT_13760 [Hypoxylon sp. CI-4A]|nr:hypothetical protein M426DRAFT_13760 [Hypoxylon sp. CI-4A]